MNVQDEVAKFDPKQPIERASMPPASWYVSPEFYTYEQRAVLWSSWQPVCRVEQLKEPGDRVAGCFAGLPWVVARGEDDEIVAFENVCRHKASEVVPAGESQGRRLVCQYHGWVYDLQGRLRGAPRMQGAEGFAREDYSLRPLAVEVWGPWIFICRATKPDSLQERLGPLSAELDDAGWRRLTWVETRRWTLECNWKVYVDNYLDGGYHVPILHPTLNQQLDMKSYRTELYATYNVQRSGASQAEEGGRIGDGAIYAWVYPNFMLNRYGPCLDSNWVVPLGPDRCEVVYDFFFDATEGPEARAAIEASIAQSDITQREDVYISEAVQRGLASSTYSPGRYAPAVEIAEHQFHRLLAADYRRAARPDTP